MTLERLRQFIRIVKYQKIHILEEGIQVVPGYVVLPIHGNDIQDWMVKEFSMEVVYLNHYDDSRIGFSVP